MSEKRKPKQLKDLDRIINYVAAARVIEDIYPDAIAESGTEPAEIISEFLGSDFGEKQIADYFESINEIVSGSAKLSEIHKFFLNEARKLSGILLNKDGIEALEDIENKFKCRIYRRIDEFWFIAEHEQKMCKIKEKKI